MFNLFKKETYLTYPIIGIFLYFFSNSSPNKKQIFYTNCIIYSYTCVSILLLKAISLMLPYYIESIMPFLIFINTFLILIIQVTFYLLVKLEKWSLFLIWFNHFSKKIT